MTRVDDALRDIAGEPGSTLRPGLGENELSELEERLGVRLPDAHRRLLRHTNGLEVNRGDTRVYGYGPDTPIDLVWWNDPGTWRFAWEGTDYADDLAGLVFVGGSFRGAQLSYRREDLPPPDDPVDPDPPLWFVNGYRMKAVPLGGRRPPLPGFSGWLDGKLRNAGRGPDPVGPGARARFPVVPATHLLVLSPPRPYDHTDPDPDNAFDPDDLRLVPAADAMIAAGRERARSEQTWRNQDS